MKKLIFPIISILLIISCSNNSSNTQNQEVQALEDNYYNDFRKSSSRYSLIERLYKEALENNEALQELDDKIKNSDEEVSELLSDYKSFLNQNQEYYHQALSIIDYQIKDSLLKVQTKKKYMLKLKSFNESVSILNKANKTIQSLDLQLDDAYILLKLEVTHDLITKYQSNKFPKSEKLDKAVRLYEQLIKESEKI